MSFNQSFSNYSSGGQIPTAYTNNVDLVLTHRARYRDSERREANWQRFNNDFDRTSELNDFHTKIEKHRRFYRDKSTCDYKEKHFIIPVTNEEKIQQQINMWPVVPSENSASSNHPQTLSQAQQFFRLGE